MPNLWTWGCKLLTQREITIGNHYKIYWYNDDENAWQPVASGATFRFVGYARNMGMSGVMMERVDGPWERLTYPYLDYPGIKFDLVWDNPEEEDPI